MFVLLGVVVVLSSLDRSSAYYTGRECVAVPQFCKNLTNGDKYRKMRVPNAFNYFRTSEVQDDIQGWGMLLNRCHQGLKLFLCTIYAPVCPETGEFLPVIIKPCRSFCQSVRSSCEPVMTNNNYSWPTHEAFNCSSYEDNTMCIREDSAVTPTDLTTTTTRPVVQGSEVICDPNYDSDLLLRKACSSRIVLKAEITSNLREAKGDSSMYFMKIFRHKKPSKTGSRNSRKTRRPMDSPDRVFLPKDACKNSLHLIKKGDTYLMMLEKRAGKKTKYIVNAIIPWKKKLQKILTMRKTKCRRHQEPQD